MLFKFRYLPIVGLSFDGIMNSFSTLEHTREKANVTFAGKQSHWMNLAFFPCTPSISRLELFGYWRQQAGRVGRDTRPRCLNPSNFAWGRHCEFASVLSLPLSPSALQRRPNKKGAPPPGNSCGALCAQDQGRAWGIFAQRLEPRSLREDCMEQT